MEAQYKILKTLYPQPERFEIRCIKHDKAVVLPVAEALSAIPDIKTMNVVADRVYQGEYQNWAPGYKTQWNMAHQKRRLLLEARLTKKYAKEDGHIVSSSNSSGEERKAVQATYHIPTGANPTRPHTPEKATNTKDSFSNPYTRQKSSLR